MERNWSLHCWHFVVFQALQISAWHLFAAMVQCQSALGPASSLLFLCRHPGWFTAFSNGTGHLCFGQESWPSLCESARSWRATTMWSWPQPSMAAVSKLDKSLNRYVCAIIIFSLSRLAVGWALQLPALAENESPVGCCISQSRWELSGAESEIMERDTTCNSSLWAGKIEEGDRWVSSAKERISRIKMLKEDALTGSQVSM